MKRQTLKKAKELKQESIKHRVCEMLGMTVEQYHEVQFDIAVDYMRQKCNGDERFLSAFLNEPVFWRWWKQQWCLVDERFVHQHWQSGRGEVVRMQLKAEWMRQHRNIDTYPDRVVYNKVFSLYEKMVDQLTQHNT